MASKAAAPLSSRIVYGTRERRAVEFVLMDEEFGRASAFPWVAA